MQTDFEEYDSFDQADYGSPGHFLVDKDSVVPSDDEDELVDARHVSRHLRRSRPPIDFSHSTVGSNSTTAFSRLRSYVSRGLTLHSGLKPATTSFPYKAPSLDSSPKIPIAVIVSLTISDLYHNPHYLKLRQKYDNLAGVLTAYMGQNLAESRVTTSNTLVSHVKDVPYIPSGSH
jgi:hypothetical protein